MICAVTENGQKCGRRTHARELCTKHLARWRTHKDPLHIDPKGRPPKYGTPGYQAAHKRVARLCGRASGHLCECGRPARHWALAVAPTLFDVDSGLGYSLDPEEYRPLCVACHYRFDGQEIRSRDSHGRIATGAIVEITREDSL